MSAIATDIRRPISKNIAPIGQSGEYAYSSPAALMVPETVNEAEMSAEFVIVSKVEDREYDVITPQGCEEYLDEYRRNPVVLLEHDALKPIGLSTDRAGVFHFRVLADRIIAKCFFHCLPLNGENLSEEVFRLVTKGVFRGASPGFLPIRGRKRGYEKDAGYEYYSWRLTEWSITSQPVNQDALRLSLNGVRCKSLRRTLESLVLPKEKAKSIATRWEPGSRTMKPKTASIEFDKSIFAEEKAAVAWLDQHGYDSSACTPLPASFIFKQRGGKLIPGKKSLGTGVWALQTKAFGKDDEKDEDDDKKKKKDEKPNDIADEKVEKADDEAPEEEDDDDELDDVEDGDAEDDEDCDEGEGDTEDTTEYDPAALKKEADNLMDLIAHFDVICDNMERMKSESVKSPELFAKLHADAETYVNDLKAAYKDGFADVAMEDAIKERKAGATDKEETPVDSTAGDASPDEYKEMAKSLKELATGVNAAKKTAKSLPRLAVA